MKAPRPGQFWSPDGVHIVRCSKRVNGCRGCLYEDSIILCPGVHAKNGQTEPLDCTLNGIIFVKP